MTFHVKSSIFLWQNFKISFVSVLGWNQRGSAHTYSLPDTAAEYVLPALDCSFMHFLKQTSKQAIHLLKQHFYGTTVWPFSLDLNSDILCVLQTSIVIMFTWLMSLIMFCDKVLWCLFLRQWGIIALGDLIIIIIGTEFMF